MGAGHGSRPWRQAPEGRRQKSVPEARPAAAGPDPRRWPSTPTLRRRARTRAASDGSWQERAVRDPYRERRMALSRPIRNRRKICVKPYLVTSLEAGRLPRWIPLLLCAVYVIAGLFGRDPWRPDDAAGFGIAHTMALGSSIDWLVPNVHGSPGATGQGRCLSGWARSPIRIGGVLTVVVERPARRASGRLPAPDGRSLPTLRSGAARPSAWRWRSSCSGTQPTPSPGAPRSSRTILSGRPRAERTLPVR